jgi:hypothetical protein
MTRTMYGVASWVLLAFGLVHIAAAPSRFDTLTSGTLWFVSGGVLLVVVASLNLLNRAYGAAAPGLRRVALAANIVNLALAIASGVVGRSGIVGWLIVLAILVPLAVLSAIPRAYGVGAPPSAA